MNVTAACGHVVDQTDEKRTARMQLAYPFTVSLVHANRDLPGFAATRMPLQARTHWPIIEADRQPTPHEAVRQDVGEHVQDIIEGKCNYRLIHQRSRS